MSDQKQNPEYQAPAIDWESRAYWEGAGRGELVLQRCRDCGVVQHRPLAGRVTAEHDDPLTGLVERHLHPGAG